MAKGQAVGREKGHILNKKPTANNSDLPSYRKGTQNKRVKAVRDVIRDVAGLAPYEKRVLDILKTGGSNSEKRAYKFAKGRLGTHKRALKKREEIKSIYSKIRAGRM